MEKPPLGLRPKYIADLCRFGEVTEAIFRYTEAGMEIPMEWEKEYLDLKEVVKEQLSKLKM